ncbi:MSHA biogenesis protein MshI [Paraglaciecola aestuariivivens]
MQIGWRDFIKGHFKKASKFHSLGIEIGVNDFHISVIQKSKGQLHWVKQHSLPIDDWQSELKTFVEKNHLANTKCNVALSISKYQLLQLDRPEVAENEINQALQWSVKEQLFSEFELAIDYFDPPVAASNVKKVNVVAIGEQEICDIRDGVLKAGLNLNTIGVEELVTCNLVEPSDDAVIILKHEDGGQLSLNIVKRNLLYFSRRLRGYENIASFSKDELKMAVVDNLSLEIQRSMDYFESQLRQAPVKKVYLSLDTIHQEELESMIKEVIFISVEKLVPNIINDNHLPLLPTSFASLGAAVESPSLVTS